MQHGDYVTNRLVESQMHRMVESSMQRLMEQQQQQQQPVQRLLEPSVQHRLAEPSLQHRLAEPSAAVQRAMDPAQMLRLAEQTAPHRLPEPPAHHRLAEPVVQQRLPEPTVAAPVRKIELHDCHICGASFIGVQRLESHINNHRNEEIEAQNRRIREMEMKKNQPHDCRICGAVFDEDWKLDAHILSSHKVEKNDVPKSNSSSWPYICQLCDSKFDHKNQLLEHLISKHKAEPSDNNGAADSGDDDTDVKTEPFLCQFCDSLFREEQQLEDHIAELHQPEENDNKPKKKLLLLPMFNEKPVKKEQSLITNIDDFCFTTKRDNKKPQFFCKLCHKKFNKSEQVEEHIDTYHTEEEMEEYERSKKKIPKVKSRGRKSSVPISRIRRAVAAANAEARVTRSRTFYETISCHFCHVEFEDHTSLVDHLKEHNEAGEDVEYLECNVDFADDSGSNGGSVPIEPVTCQLCDLVFDDFLSLDDHLKSTHTEADIEQFYKNQSFVINFDDDLDSPRPSRRGKKKRNKNKKTPTCPTRVKGNAPQTKPSQLICFLCTKIFAQVHTLKRHIRQFHKEEKDSGGKPKMVICKLCGKDFASNWNLNKHLTTFHSIIDCEDKDEIITLDDSDDDNDDDDDNTIENDEDDVTMQNDEDVTMKDDEDDDEPSKSIKPGTSRSSKNSKSSTDTTAYCRICKKSFSSSWYLREHTDLYHKQSKDEDDEVKEEGEDIAGTNACHLCTKRFVKKSNAKRHIKVVHGIAGDAGLNGDGESEEMQQQQMLLSETLQDSSYTCDQCNKVFPEKYRLTKHLLTVHTKEKFQCEICNKVLKNEMTVKIHMSNFHSERTIYSCDVCDKQFKVRRSLDDHKLFYHQTDQNVNVCSLCNKGFSTNNVLQNHIKTVHDKIRDHECDVCEKKFSSGGDLKRHVNLVHQKIRPFKCPDCPKSFGQASLLRDHISYVHDKVKSFFCKLCSRQFSRRQEIRHHIASFHLKMKPFVCPVCNKKFSAKPNLTKHLRVMHKNILKKKPNLDQVDEEEEEMADEDDAIGDLEGSAGEEEVSQLSPVTIDIDVGEIQPELSEEAR